jgi:hypothetical protein
LITFPLADDYSYGILQSGVHWAWFIADFRGGVTCLFPTQFSPENSAISPSFVGP